MFVPTFLFFGFYISMLINQILKIESKREDNIKLLLFPLICTLIAVIINIVQNNSYFHNAKVSLILAIMLGFGASSLILGLRLIAKLFPPSTQESKNNKIEPFYITTFYFKEHKENNNLETIVLSQRAFVVCGLIYILIKNS